MNRSELYAKVKELHLEEAIKTDLKDVYVRISSPVLEDYINMYTHITEEKRLKAIPQEEQKEEKAEQLKTRYAIISLYRALKDLVLNLREKHLLLDSECNWADISDTESETYPI